MDNIHLTMPDIYFQTSTAVILNSVCPYQINTTSRNLNINNNH